MSKNYFETCREFTSQVDVAKLSAFPLGAYRRQGGNYAFIDLGTLSTSVLGETAVGVKLPLEDRFDVSMRFVSELSLTYFVTNDSREHKAHFPSFMSLISLDTDEKPVGILTEDASHGGRICVRGRPATDKIREMIYEPFKSLGLIDDVLVDETCDRSLTFDVNGKEMILDMTPNPVRRWLACKPYRAVRDEATDLLPDLTIAISSVTPLGRDLKKIIGLQSSTHK